MDLYFEMYSGIAGDMTIAALLDLGASKDKLVDGINSLGLNGFELLFERASKNGIDAYNFDVSLEGQDHDHHHHHEHHHDHSHSHDHEHDHHSHEGSHDHHHEHEHEHSHDHVHRNLESITEIINSSDLNDNIKKNALGIFDIIGDAEAKAHGIAKSEVHFHEVGAIDSIIDIVGTCILLDDLGVENIYFSDLFEGSGYQMCAHGPMPIPVPAVANILADSDINLNFIGEEGEHITPTGAAIVKYFYKKAPTNFRIKKIGLGAGNKDFEKTTNILRVMEIETDKKKL